MNKTTNQDLFFEVGIVEHCNLNCRGCSHFSPIAEPYFMDPDVFDRDMARLSALFHGQASWIHIMGGEPLLHPRCTEFLEISRKWFQTGRIDLITNGILLKEQDEEFWDVCKRNAIVIKPTRYPLAVDFDTVREKAQRMGINFRFYNYEDDGSEKKLDKYVLDLAGTQNHCDSFLLCAQANRCLTLKEGKMYTCPTIPYAYQFERRFGTHLPVSQEDYVDITNVSSGEELLQKLAKAPPFCRFCNQRENLKGLTWGVSSQDIHEWV